jgi:hypothetical protein
VQGQAIQWPKEKGQSLIYKTLDRKLSFPPQRYIFSQEIDFGMTRPEFEPTIYRTRGEHTNHYATDAVRIIHIHVIKGTTI